MRYLTPSGPATPAALPIPGETTYYPAIRHGTFGSVRAALASIGCIGADAALHEANAKAEGSAWIAVPVTCADAPPDAGDCVALVKRKPGGRAALMLGLIGKAEPDEAKAYNLAREISGNIGGVPVFIFTHTCQRGAVQ